MTALIPVILRGRCMEEEFIKQIIANERAQRRNVDFYHIEYYECPVCSKKFFIYSDWAYKRSVYKSVHSQNQKSVYYCSWSCLRKADEAHALTKRSKIRH